MQTPSVKLSSGSGGCSRNGSGTGFVSVFYLDTQDQFASDTIFLFKFILDVCAITMRSKNMQMDAYVISWIDFHLSSLTVCPAKHKHVWMHPVGIIDKISPKFPSGQQSVHVCLLWMGMCPQLWMHVCFVFIQESY